MLGDFELRRHGIAMPQQKGRPLLRAGVRGLRHDEREEVGR